MASHRPASQLTTARGDRPLVSVVIPCYNHARFLGEAIESVLAQTYPAIEVVVVDDGSTDETSAVAATYPSARYVWQRNGGLAAARNTGMRVSTGAFLAFLDADDRFLPGAIESGVACLCSHPEAAFAWGHYRLIDRTGAPSDVPRIPLVGEAYEALLRRNVIAMHATVLYRRAPLEAAGGFDSRMAACEDYDMYLRLAREHSAVAHGALVAEYRIHGANMSRDAARMLRTALGALQRQKPYVHRKPHLADAHREGQAFWRRYFGDRLVNEVVRAVKRAAVGLAARGLVTLLVYAPSRLVHYLRYRLVGRSAPDSARP